MDELKSDSASQISNNTPAKTSPSTYRSLPTFNIESSISPKVIEAKSLLTTLSGSFLSFKRFGIFLKKKF